MRSHSRIVIGHHLILHGYGHWLPNDPRGSGSREVRKEELKELGPAHFGRKKVQPRRTELREFKREAAPRLEFAPIWFEEAERQAVGQAIGDVVQNVGYTVWACAVLKNHVHLCVRRHRDESVTIWRAFAEESRKQLCLLAEIPGDHPVWSERPYKVFLYTPEDVERVINYIEENPEKEGLPAQSWDFITAYDGWPHRRPKQD